MVYVQIMGQLLFAKNVDRVVWGEAQAKRFREAIAHQDFSVREIAAKAGVHFTYVQKLKKPCKAEMRSLLPVLEAVGLDLYSVFGSPTISLLEMVP